MNLEFAAISSLDFIYRFLSTRNYYKIHLFYYDILPSFPISFKVGVTVLTKEARVPRIAFRRRLDHSTSMLTPREVFGIVVMRDT
jgi:hypothetical protein